MKFGSAVGASDSIRTFICLQAMGWALLFVASAGTGAAGLLLCVVMGVMYTLGFILASAGELGIPCLKVAYLIL